MINNNILKMLKEAKEKENKELSEAEGLEAVELTGQIINSIMNGKSIDLAFYKLYTQKYSKKLKSNK